jgi:hypothetical protein
VGYKGIIGSSGVLDVRYAKASFSWWFGSGTGSPLTRTGSINSRIPINPNGDVNDPLNYYSQGLLSALAVPSNSTNPNPYASSRNTQFNGHQNDDKGDNGGNTALTANYQHFLSTQMGNHMIDVGFQKQDFDWALRAWENPTRIWVPGQIAYNLSPGDIYNPSGVSPSQQFIDQNYAGKFIVFNTTTARFSDVDPVGVAYRGMTDGPFILPNGTVTNVANIAGNVMPRMIRLFGNEDGSIYQQMMSYYINDLWSINDHHSVMVGVRFDNFKVGDAVRQFHSYSLPTFRFDYKFDPNGDQSRLFNLTLAQFHNNPGAGIFFPMVQGRLANRETRYWSAGTSTPYLVDKDELLKLSNYGFATPGTVTGENAYVDSGFKAPVSTEISIGMRRNLSNGGSYKVTYINRSWANDYDYYPGEVFTNVTGTTDVTRILKNSDGTSRSFNSIELEWDFPITKRVNFGGSYAFTRFMDNTSNHTDNAQWWDIQNFRLNMDSWLDQQFGSREAWRPAMPSAPEHVFKFYLLFDLSSKKMDSSLTFMGNYWSGSFPYTYMGDFWNNGFKYMVGYPTTGIYANYIAGTNGSTVPGSIGPGIFRNPNDVWVPTNIYATMQDDWWLNMRYMVSVPLVNKFSWLATITVSNPFNHRGLRGGRWHFDPSMADALIVPNTLYNGDGSVGQAARNTYSNGARDVWRSTSGPMDGLYQNRMEGRSFSVQTGIKF